MRSIRNVVRTLAIAFLAVLPALADGTIETRTHVEVGAGMAGKLIDKLDGKDGDVRMVAIRGPRMMETGARKGTLIDLEERLVYDVNLGRQKYTTRTFEEVRAEMQQRAEMFETPVKDDAAAPVEPIRYVTEVDFGPTGGSMKVGGYEATEYRLEVVVRRDGMTLDEGGGGVLTATTMVGPKLKMFDEVRAFRREYFEQLGLDEALLSVGEPLAKAIASDRALQEAIAGFQSHRSDLEGAPLRTTLRLETVAPPEPEEGEEGYEKKGLMKRMGGAFKGKKGKRVDETGRRLVFETTSEVLSVSWTDGGLTRLHGFEAR